MTQTAGAGSVLITGTSSGIGAVCARALDRRGFRVFAGVRHLSDAAALQAQCSPALTPVVIDVTQEASIRAAREQVAAATGDAGLLGLVNNAGYGVAGPLEFMPLDDLRRQLEVNVTGQVAVTQAFLPLLRRAQGRIVFMGSVAGRVAPPMMGPYAASKHALEAIADAWRVELHPWHIGVSIIEPGAVRTDIWEKGLAGIAARIARMPAEGQELYGDVDAQARTQSARIVAGAIHPGHVARAVHHALTARQPKARYVVGRDARISITGQHLVPARLRDRIVRWKMGL